MACEKELEGVRTQLAQTTMARTLLNGQLATERGDPQDWPAAVPQALGPPGFESAVAAWAESEGLELVDVQCEEYPCLGVLSIPDEGWTKERQLAIQESVRAWARELNDGAAPLNTHMVSAGDTHHLAFAAFTEPPTAEARQRVSWRMEQTTAPLIDP